MFKDRKEFEEALIKSVEVNMTKAKFISPEQQKANKEKNKTLSNKEVLSTLPKAPNEFNEKGVPNLHIKCMKDALEHFESPPSAHCAVKGHLLGRDLSDEEAHDIYEGPHSGFGSELPDPEEIMHNENINPDLYNDNRVHEMLHSMEPEKIKSLAAKLHDWHSEKLEPGYYGEGDEDTLEDTKAHLNNLKLISDYKAKPKLGVVKTRKEFEEALIKSVEADLQKGAVWDDCPKCKKNTKTNYMLTGKTSKPTCKECGAHKPDAGKKDHWNVPTSYTNVGQDSNTDHEDKQELKQLKERKTGKKALKKTEDFDMFKNRKEFEEALIKSVQEELEKAKNKEFYDYESHANADPEGESSAPRKYQGGDPKHSDRGKTRAGQSRAPAISDGSKKLKMPHTGISDKGAKVRGVTPFEKYENAPRGSEQKIGIDMPKHRVPSRYSSYIHDPKSGHTLHVDTSNGDYILRHSDKVIDSGVEPSESKHKDSKRLGKKLGV